MAYVATGAAGLALGDQGEDMDAINRFMMNTPFKTSAAEKLHNDWLRWYDALSWYDRNYSTNTYDAARNRRNAFLAANATTAAEQQAADTVKRTGLTTEEMFGKTKRITSKGEFPETDDSFLNQLPTWAKWGIGITVVGGLAYLLNVRGLTQALLARKKH